MNVSFGSIVRLGTGLVSAAPPPGANTGHPWPSTSLCLLAVIFWRIP